MKFRVLVDRVVLWDENFRIRVYVVRRMVDKLLRWERIMGRIKFNCEFVEFEVLIR